MMFVHINVYQIEHRDFEEEIRPRTIQQTCGIQADGPGIEREYICMRHQGTAASEETLTQILRHLIHIRITFLEFSEELLETGCCPLLSPAIVGIVVMKRTRPKSPLLRKALIDGALLFRIIELTVRFPFLEEEMYLTIIIRQRGLW